MDQYICLELTDKSASFEEHIEAAEELADEKCLPVMIRPPYRRRIIVMPKEHLDQSGTNRIFTPSTPAS